MHAIELDHLTKYYRKFRQKVMAVYTSAGVIWVVYAVIAQISANFYSQGKLE